MVRHPDSQRFIPLHLAGDRTRREAPPPVVESPRLVSEVNPHGTRYVRKVIRLIAEGAVEEELKAARAWCVEGGRYRAPERAGGAKRLPRGTCLHCGQQVPETSRYARACNDGHRTAAMKALQAVAEAS